MEPKQSNVQHFAIVAVVAAIVGGAIVFAFAPGEAELNQLRSQRDTLKLEVEAFKQRIGPLQGEVKTLQEQNTALKTEADRLTQTLTSKEQTDAKVSSALDDRQRAMDELQKRNQSITAENESLKKTLAELREKTDASAAERKALAAKLGAADRTLETAQARSAELNKSYEALLKEKTTLAERAAARRTELETTKKSFEEAQREVARLSGARGIYTVQNGDSLSTIAAFFYRDSLRWADIFKANSFLISHPDLIYPKQVLIVPH